MFQRLQRTRKFVSIRPSHMSKASYTNADDGLRLYLSSSERIVFILLHRVFTLEFCRKFHYKNLNLFGATRSVDDIDVITNLVFV
jgi:hypothetical protein